MTRCRALPDTKNHSEFMFANLRYRTLGVCAVETHPAASAAIRPYFPLIVVKWINHSPQMTEKSEPNRTHSRSNGSYGADSWSAAAFGRHLCPPMQRQMSANKTDENMMTRPITDGWRSARDALSRGRAWRLLVPVVICARESWLPLDPVRQRDAPVARVSNTQS